MPKNVDHDLYRNTLLEKCYNLFSQKGFSSVTMREIAKENGVSTGTLYHYFPNKATILEQLFSWAAVRNINEYNRISGEDPSFENKLNNITDFLAESENDYLNHLSLSLDLIRNSPEASEEVLHIYSETFKNAIINILGVDRKLAEVIFIYLLGCATHAKISPKEFSFKDAVLQLKQAVQSPNNTTEEGVLELIFRSMSSKSK